MNLAKNDNWDLVTFYLTAIGSILGYIVIGVLTGKFIVYLEPTFIDISYLAGFLWPVGLPITLAATFPFMTLGTLVTLLGGTFFVLRRMRNKQIAKIAEDKLLREEGVI